MGRAGLFGVGLTVLAFLAGSAAAADASPNPSWAVQHSPNMTATSPDNELSGVACPSSSTCFAVGFAQPQLSHAIIHALIERRGGSTWTVMTAPKVSTETYLNAIACVSAKNCVAVGIDASTGDSRSIIEQWNGTKWSVASTPSVSGAVEDQLSSVSCVSATSCIAVGGAFDGSWHPLIERWSGKRWSLVASPALGALNGVSCVAPLACTAVGGGAKQIIEQTTDGNHWKTVTAPAGGDASAVVCISASSCYAVAHLKSGSGSNNPPVFEYSNGTHWAYMQMPVRSGHPNVQLTGLSCTSNTNCLAVGNDGATLAEHFDGKAWTIEHTQDPGANNLLSGVACLTAARCTAVGSWRNTGNTNTLVENRAS